MEFSYLTAFMIGLLGSSHCLGMCGGIVGALNAENKQTPRSIVSVLSFNLSYNTGRITSYIIAGGLVGLLGALVSQSTLATAVPVGRFLAGIIMILLGFYLAGLPQLLAPLEKTGLHLWKMIEPFGRAFLPSKTPLHAFRLGLIWGWLPCGLVYSTLALAAVSASPVQGAAIMLAFGVGTIPMLMVMGGAAKFLFEFVRKPMVRKAAGTTMIFFGIYICMVALASHEHAHHALVSEFVSLHRGTVNLTNSRRINLGWP